MNDFLSRNLILIAFMVTYMIVRNLIGKARGKPPLSRSHMVLITVGGLIGTNLMPVLGMVFS